MKAHTVRQQFVNFFKERDHTFVRSASLVPRGDPTLLFTNAGMNQFKNIFLGKNEPKYSRAVNSQKCIRVSGKHNDLEDVGYDVFHHTFFEMLGNWSFGDYYKEEAILWAWELLTEVWGLSKDRLWATVYEKDDEADELWRKVTDIHPDHILRFGKKENFWEMGETGPCGPCSEIHYYIGKDISKQKSSEINVSDLYWELWNLVFIQSDRNSDGSLDDLRSKHVDTGAGLERIAAVLQGKTSNYDTDLFQPIIHQLEKITNTQYKRHKIAYRAISDHARMLTFSIADGVLPSNEGRGYVVRRVLRRAARFGRDIGVHDPFLSQLANSVVNEMGETYPELVEKQSHVENVIQAEELKFNEALDRGLDQFEKIITDLSGTIIPGNAAFKLYDTYGFPIDLTEQIAREKGLKVDTEGFENEMSTQRQRARSVTKFKLDFSEQNWITLSEGEDSFFSGYTDLVTESTIRRIQQLDDRILVILDITPFYGEQGGQVGDVGKITGDGFKIEVTDTVKDGDTHIHMGRFKKGEKVSSNKVKAEVDRDYRQKIRLNHTAAHLLHKALKMSVGEHVQQSGSMVSSEYLRFDFTHYQRISREEIRKIEEIVNREIQNNLPLSTEVKSLEDARKEGAVAIFEEKYGDQVRVVSIGDFSKELCGGTHVDRTGDIGLFKIIEESSLAAGVSRILAYTGPGAIDYVLNNLESLSRVQELLNCSLDEIVERISNLLDQKKQLGKELKKIRESGGDTELTAIVEKGEVVGNHRLVISEIKVDNLEHLKSIGDRVLALIGSGIGVLGTKIDSKPSLVCVVTDNLIRQGIKADELARSFGNKFGGGGGGKAHLATAGGKNFKKFSTVFSDIKKDLISLLKGSDE